jgi:competence protein ComEC
MGTEWDGVRIDVLGPPRPKRPPLRVRNDDSVVLGVRLGEVSLLLPGDMTAEAGRAMRVPPSLVVKVPHHGGRAAAATDLAVRTAARLAVVSVGAHNPFGHPDPGVLESYRRSGALVLRTDRDGTVEVATDGRGVWVRTAAEGEERRIR